MLHMIRDRSFGEFLRERRMTRAAKSRAFSLRQLAGRVGIEPSYLSKIERDEQPLLGRKQFARIAAELDEDPDAPRSSGQSVQRPSANYPGAPDARWRVTSFDTPGSRKARCRNGPPGSGRQLVN